MNITVEKEKEIKSQRARELDELRSKGVAKTRKLKLNDLMTSPLTTPEQAHMFLAVMRDKSKKEGFEHQPPTNLSSAGVDAWYMAQRQREKEMKQRRKEAEQLLRGYRGPYFDDTSLGWASPKNSRRSRSSFGAVSETLRDPATIEKRRQTTMPRLQNNWNNEDVDIGSHGFSRGRLGPERTDFLHERQHYDGTQYGKPDERTAYLNGRALFREGYPIGEGEQRDPSTSYDRSRFSIDTNFSGTTRESSDIYHGAGGQFPPGNEVRDPSDIYQRADQFNTGKERREPIPSASVPGSVPVPVPSHDSGEIPETIWRDFISPEPGAKFPPEAGRYHLYASYACPGSHRALIVRALKGLEDVVSVTIVHPTWRHTNLNSADDKHRGWIFGDPTGKPFRNTTGRGGPFPAAYPGNDPDPILNAYSVRELYEYAQDTSGKYTIPLLWDKKLNTIVNNESSDISYMLNSCFNDFSSAPELDLYTEDDEDGLDKLNEVSQWLYPMMIHGVYRCGFAKTQEAYDHAIDELTSAFDMADQILQTQRYLTGDILTDADIRLFVTLLRFDEVYAFYFRANTRLVMLTPALLDFCREIYQMPGVAGTCHMDQIKAHFFGSHAEWNKYSVIPRGLGFINLLQYPHNRDQFDHLSTALLEHEEGEEDLFSSNPMSLFDQTTKIPEGEVLNKIPEGSPEEEEEYRNQNNSEEEKDIALEEEEHTGSRVRFHQHADIYQEEEVNGQFQNRSIIDLGDDPIVEQALPSEGSI